MGKKTTSIKPFTGLLVSVAAVCFSLVFCLTPWGKTWDAFLGDFLFLMRGPLPSPKNVVVVAIDEPSFGVIKKQWPWPRSLHAKLLNRLFKANAKVVVLDILFAEPSRPEEDLRLAGEIRMHPGVVLSDDIDVTRDKNFDREIIVGPIPQFRSPKTETGFINLPVAPDGFVRKLNLTHGALKSLALVAALKYTECRWQDLIGGNLYINFSGPPRTIKTISYYQALDPDQYLPPDFFKGKLVFVGFSTQSAAELKKQVKDHYDVPFSRWGGGLMAGVELHAQIAQNLIDRTVLRGPGLKATLVLGLLLGLMSTIIFIMTRPALSLAVFLTESAVFLGTAYVFFSYYYVRLPLLFMLVPTGTSFFVSHSFHYWQTWKEKNFIRKAFSTYISPQMLQVLIRRPDLLSLGGETVEATVFFLDIAGFTFISEKLAPEALFEILNRYLKKFTTIILRNSGMVDKYIGDAVMAVWGIPVSQENHAFLACKTALEIQNAVTELWKDGESEKAPRLEIRIGINSGWMMAGNVGGTSRFSYTVLGNEVNLASRLEGVNKVYHSVIVIGENTAKLVNDAFELRELDLIRVKGKVQTIKIFELQAFKGGLDDIQSQVNVVFESGRQLYLKRRWKEARACFERGIALEKDDGPCRVYARRCEIFEKSPPEADWEGVFEMTVK
jgi:adenylate cyclase